MNAKRTSNWEFKHLKKLKSLPYEQAHPKSQPQPQNLNIGWQYMFMRFLRFGFTLAVVLEGFEKIKVVLGFALTAPLPEWKWDSLLAVLLTQSVVLKSLKHQTFHSGTLTLPPNPVNTQLSFTCVKSRLLDFEIIIWNNPYNGYLKILKWRNRWQFLEGWRYLRRWWWWWWCSYTKIVL